MIQPYTERSPEPFGRDAKIWTILFAAVMLWLAVLLCSEIDRPWINGVDYNGAVWSQAAHNILRAGLIETHGASSGFYFGPLPIPPWGYYLHHPPLLHLGIAGLFSIFGEDEWVARLVPVTCSLASAVFLWLLVRSCAGTRAATFSTAIFACLPMQLRYGAMVNFESCVLMLVLGALVCLRWHHLTGRLSWKIGALGFVIAGLWVDWAMYLFVAAWCGCWLLHVRGSERRFAVMTLLCALVSGAFYLVRINVLRPDAWQNLSHTFMTRLGTGKGGYFTEMQWLERIGHTLIAHFLPAGLVLGVIGALVLWRRRDNVGLRWLGRAALSIFVMDALFVGIFQNDSYIHEYIAFYLLAPVAIAGGLFLDTVIGRLRPILNARSFAGAEIAVCLLLLGLALSSFRASQALVRQFCILDYRTEEPAGLIPELGRAIRGNFSAETQILCNFLPDYGPQLAYYAQRDIVNNLSEYRFWDPHLNDPSKRVGGVVWVTSNPASQRILSQLPSGSKRFVTFGNITFCLWKRGDPIAGL
jgi:4-amino-4-deoxy-L-arabinose transferase-like glycosyltransferase